MKIIIAATDYSKNGNNAVEYSLKLANEFQSRLFIVNVSEKNPDKREMLSSVEEEETRKLSEKKLLVLKERGEKKYKKVIIETKFISQNNGADAISKFAFDIQADLVVVGSTGTNKMERILMGSTSSRLIHVAKCPVLCIPGGSTFDGIQKIVFATDLNEDNINAALSMVTFASHFKAEICFLFVDDKDLIHSDDAVLRMTQKIRKKVRYTKLSGYIAGNSNIIKGIEFFLKKNKAQILVMLTHEKSFPSMHFSQSITAMMSDRTKTPLLALKAGIVSLKTL